MQFTDEDINIAIAATGKSRDQVKDSVQYFNTAFIIAHNRIAELAKITSEEFIKHLDELNAEEGAREYALGVLDAYGHAITALKDLAE